MTFFDQKSGQHLPRFSKPRGSTRSLVEFRVGGWGRALRELGSVWKLRIQVGSAPASWPENRGGLAERCGAWGCHLWRASGAVLGSSLRSALTVAPAAQGFDPVNLFRGIGRVPSWVGLI
jgi:hypothetical protein